MKGVYDDVNNNSYNSWGDYSVTHITDTSRINYSYADRWLLKLGSVAYMGDIISRRSYISCV